MRGRGWTLVLPVLLSACARSSDQPPATAVRLVDVYKPEMVEGRSSSAPGRPRTEWRFEAWASHHGRQ